MTPEGRVKAKVSKILKAYQPDLWYFMPVPGGYGRQALDYLGFYKGAGFAIEAKAPGKKPTLKQDGTIMDIEASMTPVFVIDGENGQLEELEQWLTSLKTLP